MQNIFNFSAGPAMLPKEVMQQAQDEMLNWRGLGTSVMEVSHRGKPFIEVAEKAEADLRELLSIPCNYTVLFMQGGGRGQFSAVPMNISKQGGVSQHLLTGQWSVSAEAEARKYTKTEILAESALVDGKIVVPDQTLWSISDQADYFHYCTNETVDGVEIDWVPKSDNDAVPIVADMSSNILSKPLNIEEYGVIYAGAQKNIGPSGLALVIVRNDLIGIEREQTPSIFNYQLQAKSGSMYNTPPTFSWYLAGLVFEWLKTKGGLAKMAQRNQEKSELLYQQIDSTGFYKNNVHESFRSKMNVTFQLQDSSLDAMFLEQAESHGLVALKGHRAVGGMRASIYNAMPLEGVQALAGFMKEFERKHG
ncbi:3-phosphoserine/phosphohydroxythreonine transaminase [Brumicola blandensis]|jgi:phosphoserine aminotransferase|uniref:Phosphoserine aminotransferase n=1 Tax=Brumicola blandensis TaxID=3075611 RepID=A0AAW8QZX9_9ALTE|nr:3-phosphoserine/phosphohydroxythreonine transaminase [Alteromonas sp. W409]MDT0581410.1 3-phosphoserine/phosphohydroxythreonine transaminase [Alteromonas sp. W409]